MHLPLIEGQGNFGSVDGDPPAANTEEKILKIKKQLIFKKTMFRKPIVIPAEFPLLVNGWQLQTIPPKWEITDACLLLLDGIELKNILQW